MSARTLTAASILAFLLAGGPALALDRQSALGADGEIYTARAGAYGELFPGGRETSADSPVLALDVNRSDGTVQRLLVPGTKSADLESSPFLVFEDASRSLYMVWQTRFGYIHPVLMLSSFKEGRFGDNLLIMGNHLADKSAPQLLVTRDSQEIGSGDEITTVDRTVLHLLWAEANDSGHPDTFYSPIILENGVYSGRNDIYRLNGFDRSPVADVPFEVAPELLVAPRLQAGRDAQTITVTLADAPSRRVVSLEIDVLPQQLSRLADVARGHIIDVGVRLYPQQRKELAASVATFILAYGQGFYPEVLRAMADDVRDVISNGPLPGGPNGLQSLADVARGHIIDVGARLSGRGLRNTTQEANAQTRITETARTDDQGEILGQSHLLRFRIAASRPAPRIGAGTVTFFQSEDGERALVSWKDGDVVRYRDGNKDGSWSAIREIRLGPSLSLDQAQRILEQRVRNR